MITRFDHAVIAVRDLESAMRHYWRLGFDVSHGGRHPGRGTHNAIIRFGLDYLELLSVYNEKEAVAGGENGQALVDFLHRQDNSLLGYAVATANIAEDGDRLRQAGLDAEGPFAGQRLRPDNRLLSWRLLLPRGKSWRQAWPFLIQWDVPDEQRLAWERPGLHANTAASVAGLGLAVRDLHGAIHLYQEQLGFSVHSAPEVTEPVGARARFSLGACTIDLLAASADDSMGQVLEDLGEGPVELTLSVRDLDRARAVLAQSKVSWESGPADPPTLSVGSPRDGGFRLVLRPAAG